MRFESVKSIPVSANVTCVTVLLCSATRPHKEGETNLQNVFLSHFFNPRNTKGPPLRCTLTLLLPLMIIQCQKSVGHRRVANSLAFGMRHMLSGSVSRSHNTHRWDVPTRTGPVWSLYYIPSGQQLKKEHEDRLWCVNVLFGWLTSHCHRPARCHFNCGLGECVRCGMNNFRL